jgi:sialate O-acetylesterase
MRKSGFFLCVLLWAVLGHADLAVSRMFSDHMVLQQEAAVPVWGTAAPGAEVSVRFRDATKATKADADGKWMVQLESLKLGPAATLTVSGDGTEKVFQDVLVGEVWLGSGQSNMAGRAGGYAKKDPELAKIVSDGPYPELRLFSGSWKVADPKSVAAFSAIHVAFGHALQQELKIPVGLIVGAVGGTPSGRWLTKDMAAASKELNAQLKAKMGYDVPGIDAAHEAAVAAYKKNAAALKAEGKKAPRFRGPIRLGDLYAKHIDYIVPFAIRGVLWDQGESKTQIPGVDQYTAMSALISGWRGVWGQGFPFLHVQKPSGGGCAWDPKNPANRGARAFNPKLPAAPLANPSALAYQLDHIRMGTLPNAPLVQARDLGPGIHPANKSGYGKRASRVALGAVYGKPVAISGPVYKSHAVEGKTIRVQFNHVGQGLAAAHADSLHGFAVSGADGKWAWADARIDGDSVVVSSADVAAPVHVQYAFHKTTDFANLFNKDGLPARVFITATE